MYGGSARRKTRSKWQLPLRKNIQTETAEERGGAQMTETYVQCPKCRELVATAAQPGGQRFHDSVMRCPECAAQFTWKPRDEVTAEPQDAEATGVTRKESADEILAS